MTGQIMKDSSVKSVWYYRLTEMLVPILVWATITMPLWLSPFRPAVASYLILAYFVYFLYKTLKTIYYATISFQLMKRAERTDWQEMIRDMKGKDALAHFFIIVTYKESIEKLSHTIQAIVDQHYDPKKLNIVLAMEEREGPSAKEKSDALHKVYESKIGGMYTTHHELVEGEIVGKASNATCAAKFLSEVVRARDIDPENVIVTVCDADSILPADYTAYVTYKFLLDEDGKYRFFSAPVLLYNNFWKLPMPIRVQTMLSSVARFAYLSQRDDLIQISTYTTNLWLLESVGYWDTDIIPEDWHIWMQAFFTLGDKVRTIPIFLPIVRDGVLSTSLIKTFKSRYSQEKRWAWGASDIPYAIVRFFHSPHIGVITKLKRILFVTEVHFMWPTSFFILTISASIPSLVNPVFGRTVLGFLLPKLSSFILTTSSFMLVIVVYIDYKLRERVKIKTKLSNMPLLLIQWYFLPIISFVFSSLPALEAHTRMLLGKKLEYKVTEKL
jgi:hypothetical protein